MATILITDGDQRSALALVRSLGAAGHAVHVAASRRAPLAAASRHAAGNCLVPDPLEDPAGFVDALGACAARTGATILLPVTDAAVTAVLSHRERLGNLCVPGPGPEQYRRIADKQGIQSAAREVGIAVPRQVILRSPDTALPEDSLAFPLVVKPSRSVVPGGRGLVKTGVRYAESAPQLQRALEGVPAGAWPVLLQQRVVGPGVGVFLLQWRGRDVAVFSHRRLREKPPSGGVSVYRESIPADPDLVARSSALLRRFDWEGVAMIEYKLDAATGTPYLMEINGRFWGSLQLAVDAGVDFPRLLVDLATGREVAPVTSYRTGIRLRWWWGEVDHLLTRLRHGAAALALPPGAPGRAATLRNFLRRHPGDRREIWRRDDPRPFLRETSQWLRRR